MAPTQPRAVEFFEAQFRRQADEGRSLNPFESLALPHLRGAVIDLGCGLGNLSLAAAERGCSVLALDGSPSGIARLQSLARDLRLPIEARVRDLREFASSETFDTVVCIGLLMFFSAPDARRLLAEVQRCVAPGGVAIVNVLVEGTTYLEMFDPAAHHLFTDRELAAAFEGWECCAFEAYEAAAPGGTLKRFRTVIAKRRPVAAPG